MIIHRWWGGGEPPQTRSIVEQTHPDHEVIDHDDEFDGSPVYASNVLRLNYLYEQGGLWLDHDVIPYTDLTVVHANPWTAALGSQRIGCVMFFPKPGHPWLKSVLDKLTSDDWPHEVLPLNHVHGNVIREPRVIPYDAAGRPTGITEPLAEHMWNSARKSIVRML